MLAVLIKRILAPGMESTYEEFSRKIIQAAVPAKGFISSKAFKDINDSQHSLHANSDGITGRLAGLERLSRAQ